MSGNPSDNRNKDLLDGMKLYSVLLCALVAVSCSSTRKEPPPHARVDRLFVPTPRDRYADDLGRFLAGLPARDGSPLAALQGEPAWTVHRRELDRAWTRLGAALPPMRAFQKKELTARGMTTAPVFYPFSGPDALMATVFFPDNPSYVLVG